MDFDSIKLPTIAETYFSQTSSKDINIEDDAFTPYPTKDDSKYGGVAPSGLSQ